MEKKKRVYEVDVVGLSSFNMVLGAVPAPDPDGKRRQGKHPGKPTNEMEIPVRRLIAHLEGQKK